MTRTITAIMFALMTITITCMVLSCSRGTPPAAEEVDLGEVGTWNWVMSAGGITGDTIYADSVDYTRQLIFDTKDNYGYSYNKALVSAGKYIISYESNPLNSRMGWILKYEDEQLPSDWVMELSADTLVLAQTVIDGYTSTYVREIGL
jgi:hypothetical protein